MHPTMFPPSKSSSRTSTIVTFLRGTLEVVGDAFSTDDSEEAVMYRYGGLKDMVTD